MKRRPLTDEMLRCERCGVSFLWTAEDQRQEAAQRVGQPDHCPGCRLLLPATGRERGLVKWYNARKRYGFITSTTGVELFTHRSDFAGATHLQPGDLVEFAVADGEKGPMAVEVRRLPLD